MNRENQGSTTRASGETGDKVMFRSTDIAATQAAQDKEYFKEEEHKPSFWEKVTGWMKKHKVLTVIIIILLLLLLLLLIWLIIWLIMQATGESGRPSGEQIGPSTPETVEVAHNAALEIEGFIAEPTNTDDELVAAINAQLEEIADPSSQFSFILYVVSMLIDSGRTELAQEYLKSINESELDPDQLYLYYSYWCYIYQILGDTQKADEYWQKLIELGGEEQAGMGA